MFSTGGRSKIMKSVTVPVLKRKGGGREGKNVRESRPKVSRGEEGKKGRDLEFLELFPSFFSVDGVSLRGEKKEKGRKKGLVNLFAAVAWRNARGKGGCSG